MEESYQVSFIICIVTNLVLAASEERTLSRPKKKNWKPCIDRYPSESLSATNLVPEYSALLCSLNSFFLRLLRLLSLFPLRVFLLPPTLMHSFLILAPHPCFTSSSCIPFAKETICIRRTRNPEPPAEKDHHILLTRHTILSFNWCIACGANAVWISRLNLDHELASFD